MVRVPEKLNQRIGSDMSEGYRCDLTEQSIRIRCIHAKPLCTDVGYAGGLDTNNTNPRGAAWNLYRKR